MAYDSSFVLCVLHDGSPVREINGQVSVPFHSEYKVRLKNKHSYLRAKARVWIDGRKVSGLGDFILKPGETLDLERFLDESLSSGNRFKFVPLSDKRVNDPTDSDNGIIKVEFYREYDFLNGWQIKTITPPVKPIKPWDGGLDPTWDDNTGRRFHSGSGRGTCSSVTYTCNTSLIGNSVNYLSSPATAGATVEGSVSNQNFVYGDDFQTEILPVTLTLRLKGLQNNPPFTIVNKQDNTPRQKERFCSNCGKRRHRASDKFCGRCGTAFKTVR